MKLQEQARPPQVGQEASKQPEQRSDVFNNIVRRGQAVVNKAHELWKQSTPLERTLGIGGVGLLLASLMSPGPPESAGTAETPTPSDAERMVYAHMTRTAEFAKETDAIFLELAELQKAVPPLPENAPDLSSEQLSKFVSDFIIVNDTIKQLIRPEMIQKNPDLQFDHVLSNPELLKRYFYSGRLDEDVSREEFKDTRNPDDQVMRFLPHGGFGSVAVFIWRTASGEVYRQDIFLNVNDEKIITSKFKDPHIPQQRLKEVAEGLYIVSPETNMEWITLQLSPKSYSPTLFNTRGDGIVNGKHIKINVNSRGASFVTVETTVPNTVQPSSSVLPQAAQ